MKRDNDNHLRVFDNILGTNIKNMTIPSAHAASKKSDLPINTIEGSLGYVYNEDKDYVFIQGEWVLLTELNINEASEETVNTPNYNDIYNRVFEN